MDKIQKYMDYVLKDIMSKITITETDREDKLAFTYPFFVGSFFQYMDQERTYNADKYQITYRKPYISSNYETGEINMEQGYPFENDCTNYLISHYGLMRDLSDGVAEKVHSNMRDILRGKVASYQMKQTRIEYFNNDMRTYRNYTNNWENKSMGVTLSYESSNFNIIDLF